MDGRHARRERGQRAVINALFELIQEGNLSPSVEEVGARAGVSVATIFRNYGSLDEIGRQLVELFEERFGALFIIPRIGDGPLNERIARFCDARLNLYETTWPFISFMTVRSRKHKDAAGNLQRVREILNKQIRRHFALELGSLGQAEAMDLAATIDAFASPESWALMQASHDRTRRQIKRAWSAALLALLEPAANDSGGRKYSG
jgi:AcrR family transcriptional regulator